MARAILALGSNIGDPGQHICEAVAAVAALPGTRVIKASRLYRTPPWGKTDQPWFGNAAIQIETTLEPLALLDACLAIEAGQGRVRKERWGPREIDLDILFYGRRRLALPRLVVPHPAITERAFVLIPLKDIAPKKRIGGQSLAMLLASLDQTGIAPIGTIDLP